MRWSQRLPTRRPPSPHSPSSVFFVDDMAELLLGEAKLEQYLKEHPLRQGASPRGPRPQLTEVRKHLTAALDRGNLKVPDPGGGGPGRGGARGRGGRPTRGVGAALPPVLPFSGGDSARGFQTSSFSPRRPPRPRSPEKWHCCPQGSGMKLSGAARSSAWLCPTDSGGASPAVP